MSASKAATYLSLLDTARCTGDWAAVPELVRKLTKHGGTSKKCITETALLDHDTSPQRLSHSIHKNSTIVVSASPLSKASAPQSSATGAASTLVSISALAQTFEEEIARFKAENAAAEAELSALETEGTASKRKSKRYTERTVTSVEEIYQAEVTLAYLHHLLQAHRVVLQILPVELPTRDDVTQEWTKVCAIKALCLKGMAQEALKMKEEAIQTYKGLPIPDSNSGVGSSGAEAVYWIRKTLSRFAIASWELFEGVEASGPEAPKEAHDDDEYDEEDGLDELDELHSGLRVVQDVGERKDNISSVTPAPSEPRLELRRALTESGLIGAFRAYHAFSTSLTNLRSATAMSTLSLIKSTPDKIAAEDELSRKYIYETYLKVVSKYMKSHIERDEEIGEEFRTEINDIEEIYESLLMKMTKFPNASALNHDVLHWVDTVVDNWVTLGSRASDAGRVVEILYRAAGKTFHSPRILRYLFVTLTAIGNFHDAQLSLDTYITLIKRGKARMEKEKNGAGSSGEEDFDTDSEILTTCVQGIRFLVKYLPEQAPKAVEIATLIKTWVFEWRVEDQDILALVWRGIGLANSAWSHQTVESTQRTEIQERAIAAFRKSLDYQPEMFESMFDLGLMLAETRDIDNAIDAVRAVAEQEEKCIPAWHLLTLLLTSKGEWETALTVSEAIFSLIDESEQTSLGIGSKEGLVEIKISQLAIIEMLEGPESAVNLADELLGLYTRLFPGILPSGSGGGLSMRDSVMESERGTTRGRSTTASTITPAIQVSDGAKAASLSDPALSKRHTRSGTRGSSLGRSSLRKKRHSVAEAFTVDDEKPSVKTGPNKLHRTPSQKSAKSTKSGKSFGAKSHKSQRPAENPMPVTVPVEHIAAQAIQTNVAHSQTPSVLSSEKNGGGTNTHNLPVSSLPSPLKPYADDRPLLNRPPYLREPALGERDERKRVEAVLKRIWLTVAGLYRRAEMYEDAKVAVEEAAGVADGGRVDGGIDADVWAERGFLSAAQNLLPEAQDHFENGLAHSPDHPLTIVGLSRVLLADEKNSAARDRASGLLQTLTKLGSGWDMSEAWFELGREYELSGAAEKAKEVFWWVVQLEDTRGVRGWGCVLPRIL
ncbi:putative cargo-transport protein ypp1 [Drechslerella dactyloides]|uniref:Cargo-transport protein ypp1 n=1 Tax=Drechslerella dactyloides TaxID=74499 RepID=A0AAD6J5H0_DREDA|nr:putative cargo-transport protein ypp1 [Drechslerella dactyloides]